MRDADMMAQSSLKVNSGSSDGSLPVSSDGKRMITIFLGLFHMSLIECITRSENP